MRITGIIMTILATASIINAEAWVPFKLSDSTFDQANPAIHNNIVVFQQYIEEDGVGDWDIHGIDISDPSSMSIFEVANFIEVNETRPAIYDGLVVWESDYYEGDLDIRLNDIFDENVSDVIVTDRSGNQTNPDIFGNSVVFQDDYADDGEDKGLNILSADITNVDSIGLYFVARFDYDQQMPSIWRNHVVWEDNYIWDNEAQNFSIFGSDILQKNWVKDYMELLYEQDQQNVRIYGNYIVWQQKYESDWDILAADISDPVNPVIIPVATYTDSAAINPDIDGNIIVWQDNRFGDWDIFGFNLTTGREFAITDIYTDQTYSNQINPAIDRYAVVYEDDLEGKQVVMAVTLDGPETSVCSEKLPGDADGNCTVNLEDLALVSENWLKTNLAY